jgi:hypothetical protein
MFRVSVPTRALLLAPLAAYLAFPTRNYYWDGVAFAIEIEKNFPPSRLVHPNHLIYELWGSWLYDLFDWIGLPIRALYLMQAANCLLAGLAVLLVYRSLRVQGWSKEQGLIAAWTFGFSATWWKFATDANAYIPAIFLLLGAYLMLEDSRMIWFAGLAHAAAMLFHELAIFFLPVALLLLWKRRSSIAALATYCVEALAPVIVGYVWAYRAVHPPAGFLGWVTSHSTDSGFSFNPFRDLVYTLRGTLRLFFGGRLPDVVRDPLSVAACVLLTCALIAFLFHAWSALPVSWLSPPAALYLWLGVYLAFLFFWMPQNTFYRLFYLAPLVLILAMGLENAPQIRRAGFSFAAVLLLWNFVFLTYPESRAEFNAPLRFALAQHDSWPPGSAIVFHRFHPDLWTISYFNQQAAWFGLERDDLGEMDRDLAYARSQNQPLWVEQTAYDLVEETPAGRKWLAEHEHPEELLRFKDEKHEFVFHSIR